LSAGRAAGFGGPRHRRVQRVVVVSVDFRVSTLSPIGVTLVPLEVDPDVVVVTPLTLVVFWLLVSVETTGASTTGAVDVSVIVVLEEEDCAKAPPVMSVASTAAASKDFIILSTPGDQSGSEDRSLLFNT
jgi:hypothetical protein